MTPVTIRAPNTHLAMEELLHRLGPHALILSTRHIGDSVELIALPPDADPAPATSSPATPASATQAPAASGPARPASFAQTFQREATRGTDPLTALARRLLLPEGLAPEPVTRIIIAGPPGAGKSMLAARLAAQLMLEDPNLRPQIVAPQPGASLVEDRLRGWARLMGLTAERPTTAQAMHLPDPTPDAPQIIDLSDSPADAATLTARLVETEGAELILCLPAGLQPARSARLCKDWQAFAPTVTLTGLDLWWPERAELVAIADAGLKLTRIAAGTGLIGSLSRPAASDLRRWASGWTSASGATAR